MWYGDGVDEQWIDDMICDGNFPDDALDFGLLVSVINIDGDTATVSWGGCDYPQTEWKVPTKSLKDE